MENLSKSTNGGRDGVTNTTSAGVSGLALQNRFSVVIASVCEMNSLDGPQSKSRKNVFMFFTLVTLRELPSRKVERAK